MNYKHAFYTIVFAFLIAVVAIYAYVTLRDPFNFYTDSPVINDLIDVKPLYAQNRDYKTVMIGSSMVFNMSENDIAHYFGGPAFKFTISGASMHEMQLFTNYVLDLNKPDTYIMSCDIGSFFARLNSSFLGYSFYLYPSTSFSSRIHSLFRYELSFPLFVAKKFPYQVLSNSDSVFPLYTITTTKELLYPYYISTYENSDNCTLADWKTLNYLFDMNVAQNFRPILERLNQKKTSIFFPPYSSANYCRTRESNSDAFFYCHTVDSYLTYKRKLANILFEYPNIKVYDFADEPTVVMNPHNYWDLFHYNYKINHWILKQMAADKYRLTPENIDSRFHNFSEMMKGFDRDAFYHEAKTWLDAQQKKLPTP